MTSALPQRANLEIRPFQYRDLEAIQSLCMQGLEAECCNCAVPLADQLQQIRRWYGPLKFLSLFPNPLQHRLCIYVAELDDDVRGMIQVSPFNQTRSTWRVDRIIVSQGQVQTDNQANFPYETASQLLRHCFEKIWEARTWLIELEVNDKTALALYRHNGFQPLAQNTYWTLSPDALEGLAAREPDLSNLRPVSNTDAQLLHQLDTASMPPLVRQVFDRHVIDFKSGLAVAAVEGVKHWMNRVDVVDRYVFEPQRKAAIGHYRLQIYQDSLQPHQAELTVHPAYTWLYPELLVQMARSLQSRFSQGLQLMSSDYQPEREGYFEQMGAERVEHTLLLSRSVWHKLRETKPVSLEALQLSEMLQGFQPSRKPVPGRFALPSPFASDSSPPVANPERSPHSSQRSASENGSSLGKPPANGQHPPSQA
jgi:hypothetical protein